MEAFNQLSIHRLARADAALSAPFVLRPRSISQLSLIIVSGRALSVVGFTRSKRERQID